MQCSRKMQRYNCKFPSFKTTRPIAITSVINKMLDRILLNKIRPTIITTTAKANAGFKPEMSCQL
jgi:PBP1b-binding outer membrane lipoprotein LpoB